MTQTFFCESKGVEVWLAHWAGTWEVQFSAYTFNGTHLTIILRSHTFFFFWKIFVIIIIIVIDIFMHI